MSEDEITSIVEFGIKNISKTGFVTFEISINDVFFNTIICNDHNPAVVDDDLESHEESDEIIYDQIKTELLKELINQFYYIIREIYHVHTHHDKNHQLHSQNSNLLPIYLTNKDDFVCVNPAIVTIADNFKEKIPIYHDEINRLRIEINQKRNSSTGFTE